MVGALNACFDTQNVQYASVEMKMENISTIPLILRQQMLQLSQISLEETLLILPVFIIEAALGDHRILLQEYLHSVKNLDFNLHTPVSVPYIPDQKFLNIRQ